MKRNKPFLLVLLILLLGNSMLFAQVKRTITGVVTDNTGKPVPSATVTVNGSAISAISNENGVYSITVDRNNVTLVFSSVSFGTKEVVVGASDKLDVNLDRSATDLGEVVVTTALGIKRQKKSLAYAVQEIRGNQLSDARETNLTNALVGKVAGLQVIKSSNGAGSSAKINLRGFNSLAGDNQPLIVVDGIPMSNFTGTTENGYWGAGFDRGNGLGDISADDIESMQILKGPAAAALYGSRAGNGVIQITTKSGRKQPGIGINVSSSFGVESIFLQPEFQDQYGQGSNGIFDNRGTASWGPRIEGQNVTKWDGSTGPLQAWDNVDAFTRNGSTQNHSVSFQQQFGTTSVYTSFNRLEDKSILPGNKLQRTNLTTRATTRFGNDNRWTTDFKVQYNNTAGFNRPINGRDNSSAFVLYMLPRSLNVEDFSAGSDANGNMIWFGGSNAVNPYWRYRNDLNQDKRDRFIMSGSVKYAFNSWLDAEIKGGADMYTTSTERKIFAGSPSPRTGRYEQGRETFNERNYSALVTAKKDNIFGKFGGFASLGGNIMRSRWTLLNSNSGELVVPNFFSLNNGVSAPTVSEGYSERGLNSLYGFFGVNYDGYLFLDATVRADWSSTLKKENRNYYYPSVNLAFVVTDMIEKKGGKLPSWISYGKLRASYATVGNDLSPAQLYNVYRIGKDPNGNTTASRDLTLRDENLRSELIKNLEFGTELRFLNNRIGLDFTWYKANATRQLLKLPMDPASGYNDRLINAGDIQNKGIELMVDARILSNANGLNWSVIANYSRNKNEIIELSDALGVKQYRIGGFDNVFIDAATGSLYGDIYGTKFRRVTDPASPFVGQLLLHADGYPQVDLTQSYKLGNQQAKANIGVTNSFSYKNLSFAFLIDARIGGEMFSATHVALQSNGTGKVTAPGGVREDIVVDGVILDGSNNPVKNTKAITQQVYWGAISTANNLGIGEAYIYDATNVRLRNVQIGYDLPRKLLSKTPIQRAKVLLSCNNVWMIKSHMDGIDPESTFATGSNALGFENGAPPTMRSFNFTINLGF